MHTCPQCEDTVLALLGAIEKLRALTNEESVMLERIIRRQTERSRHRHRIPQTYVKWTADMDRRLLATCSVGERRRFATQYGLSDNAVAIRWKRLKRPDANRAERV